MAGHPSPGGFPASLPIPEDVLRIARRLEEAGYETWCVGGAVRDNLLGFENQDFDLATAARPEEVRRLFRRTVPVGIEHGTVAVLDRKNRPHEVTTFRRDVTTDGRHAVVAFGASLDEDLARRDFTINAIAYHPLRHEWRDPFGGAQDLERRLLRAVGDPAQRFREDYLRILRLLRFAARFGFEIDPPTWEAARLAVPGLTVLSAERVREEWFRGLRTAQPPSRLWRLWRELGAFEPWLPELAHPAALGPAHAVGRPGPQPEAPGAAPPLAAGTPASEAQALEALDRLPQDPVLMTSYLSADPEASLRRLKCSSAQVARARRIAAFRGRWPQAITEPAVRRWLADVGAAAGDLIAIALAEGWGAPLEAMRRRVIGAASPLTIADLAVTGDDLLAAGIPKGPAVGRTLRQLLDRVLEDPGLNTKGRLLELAASLAEPGEGPRAPRRRAPRRGRKP
jgi:tRNA nucleotidyltransferase (CCA-adding enzyme)